MVNVLSFGKGRVGGNGVGGGDATDAAGIDLDITEAGEIDHVLGLQQVMATFACGEFDRARAGG
jgi:hypothetical protein